MNVRAVGEVKAVVEFHTGSLTTEARRHRGKNLKLCASVPCGLIPSQLISKLATATTGEGLVPETHRRDARATISPFLTQA